MSPLHLLFPFDEINKQISTALRALEETTQAVEGIASATNESLKMWRESEKEYWLEQFPIIAETFEIKGKASVIIRQSKGQLQSAEFLIETAIRDANLSDNHNVPLWFKKLLKLKKKNIDLRLLTIDIQETGNKIWLMARGISLADLKKTLQAIFN